MTFGGNPLFHLIIITVDDEHQLLVSDDDVHLVNYEWHHTSAPSRLIYFAIDFGINDIKMSRY